MTREPLPPGIEGDIVLIGAPESEQYPFAGAKEPRIMDNEPESTIDMAGSAPHSLPVTGSQNAIIQAEQVIL